VNTILPLLVEVTYLIQPLHDNVDVYNISHFPGRQDLYNWHFVLTHKKSAELTAIILYARQCYGRGSK